MPSVSFSVSPATHRRLKAETDDSLVAQLGEPMVMYHTIGAYFSIELGLCLRVYHFY